MATAATGPLSSDPAGTDPLIPGIAQTTYTFNRDIATVYLKTNDFLVEAIHCNSANVAQTMPADAARFSARIADLRSFILDYVVPPPLLDMVKTGQVAKQLDASPNIVEVENQTIQGLVGLVIDFRDEMANSQSTRLPNNLMKFDQIRAIAMLDKMDQLMAYDAKSQPLDSPASTPDELMAGKGNIGA